MNTSAEQLVANVRVASTSELAEYLRSSSDAIRICGAATWLDANRPVHAQSTVDISTVNGVVEYVPGDLTMTVRAGATLAELDAITAAEGQMLGLDPSGSSQGTIGATIATASSGPLAHGLGRARDIVLGLEIVTGDGRVVRGGGKVVKNVAGFDLVRLQTGAWGTLGVITEISLRLRAIPEVNETIAITFDARKPLASHLIKLRDVTLSPLALELIGPFLAEKLGLSSSFILLVRLGGNEARVRAQRASLATLGTIETVESTVWDSLRALEDPECAVARVSQLPTELSRTWTHVHETLSLASLAPALMHASIARGVVRVVIPRSQDATASDHDRALTDIVHSFAPPGGHVVWERLPRELWQHVPSGVADALSGGLQRAFDPARRLNVGILGHSAL